MTVVKLVTPRMAPSRLAETLVMGPDEGEAQGPLGDGFEHFLFGLSGDAEVADGQAVVRASRRRVRVRPDGRPFTLRVGAGARLLWLKRRYEPLPDLPAPSPSGGHLDALPAQATAAPGLTRRELIDPDDPAHDFNMSLLHFEADTGLPQIEIHDEEHGLWMTAGGGSYHLNGEDHAVAGRRLHLHGPVLPAGVPRRPGGRRVPAVQGCLSRRVRLLSRHAARVEPSFGRLDPTAWRQQSAAGRFRRPDRLAAQQGVAHLSSERAAHVGATPVPGAQLPR